MSNRNNYILVIFFILLPLIGAILSDSHSTSFPGFIGFAYGAFFWLLNMLVAFFQTREIKSGLEPNRLKLGITFFVKLIIVYGLMFAILKLLPSHPLVFIVGLSTSFVVTGIVQVIVYKRNLKLS